jgi:hypothetical protein
MANPLQELYTKGGGKIKGYISIEKEVGGVYRTEMSQMAGR